MSAEAMNFFRRAIQPLKDRVYLMVGRAVLNAINNTPDIQEANIQLLQGETLEKVARFQEFGFASNPPKGSEGIVLAVGGNRENLAIIATEHRVYRFKLTAPGEMAIYTDDGTFVHLKKAGQVAITTAAKVEITAPLTKIVGNLEVTGTSLQTGAVTMGATLSVAGASTLTGAVTAAATLAVTGAATFSAPITAAAITGTAIVGATVAAGGVSIASIKSTFNTHTHPENGSGGGVTSAPLQSI